ncbi:unnamed protein product [Rotaria sordida]|uniref:Uncharacterized protein n=1 Tax=Rotaria sordida TaxID=392033 RepID=A0A814EIP5_9BILA|nr:unnamed protein product [Rotaria sordida]
MYKANLAPKPYASPAQCGIDQPDTLENTAKKEKKNFKKLSKRQKQIEKICEILNLSETELLNCKHSTHITRTCRAVTKRLYPDIDTQVKKCLKSLPPEQIRAIIEVKIIKKRQSDDESIEDDDEQINGYTDENQQRLKPKKRQELLNGDKPKVF